MNVPLNILEVAGGNIELARRLRGMIWDTYVDAGSPFGPTEEGMFRWAEMKLTQADNHDTGRGASSRPATRAL